MKNNKALHSSALIDENIINELDQAILPVPLSRQKKEMMRTQIFDRIDNVAIETNEVITIRENEGKWIQIAPKIKKKLLSFNLAKGIETFLLKAEPGAEIPAHDHEQDEFAYIIDGSAHFKSLELNAGDFHFAPKGSHHGDVKCPIGALIFLRTG